MENALLMPLCEYVKRAEHIVTDLDIATVRSNDVAFAMHYQQFFWYATESLKLAHILKKPLTIENLRKYCVEAETYDFTETPEGDIIDVVYDGYLCLMATKNYTSTDTGQKLIVELRDNKRTIKVKYGGICSFFEFGRIVSAYVGVKPPITIGDFVYFFKDMFFLHLKTEIMSAYIAHLCEVEKLIFNGEKNGEK